MIQAVLVDPIMPNYLVFTPFEVVCAAFLVRFKELKSVISAYTAYTAADICGIYL